LFRRLPGTPEPPWPPELRFLARRVRDRQDAVAEIYEQLEDEPPWQRTAIALTRPGNDALSLKVRDLLNVSRDEQSSWQGSDNYAPMNGWREAVERLGALVMQDGSVGLDQMRGFAAVHDSVPAILINSKDDPRARAFTLVHELAHLVFAVTRKTVRNPEARANALAAEVIMPEAWFVEEFARTTGDPLDRIQRVSRLFGTTMLATAIRAKSLDVLSSQEGEAAVGTLRCRRYIPRSGGGADYYRTAVSRLGPSFIDIVFTGLDSEVVTYTEAVSLLGNVKVENFERLRDQAHGRAGSE
jgi:Zn-dependent peptidase ImmA (M78 family)